MMQQLPRPQSPRCRALITAQSGYLPKAMQLIKDRGENPTQAAMWRESVLSITTL